MKNDQKQIRGHTFLVLRVFENFADIDNLLTQARVDALSVDVSSMRNDQANLQENVTREFSVKYTRIVQIFFAVRLSLLFQYLWLAVSLPEYLSA